METTIILPWRTIITVLFYLLVIIYVCYSVVLYYHWNTYGMEPRANTVTYITFFSLTIPLIAIMASVLYFI